jgi:hypothetical protein
MLFTLVIYTMRRIKLKEEGISQQTSMPNKLRYVSHMLVFVVALYLLEDVTACEMKTQEKAGPYVVATVEPESHLKVRRPSRYFSEPSRYSAGTNPPQSAYLAM